MSSSPSAVKPDKIQIISWLIEHFPNTFFHKSYKIKPLKIGIFDDIIDFYERLDSPPFSKKSLREALNYYSSSPAYLNCQKVSAIRVDIYGNEVDKVTKEQSEYALQRFKERYSKKKDTPPKQ